MEFNLKYFDVSMPSVGFTPANDNENQEIKKTRQPRKKNDLLGYQNDSELAAELLETKNKLKLLEEKFALLEARVNSNSFSVIPVSNGMKFIDINCEEFLLHNYMEAVYSGQHMSYNITPVTMYFDKILFGPIHEFINHTSDWQLIQPRITKCVTIEQIRGQNSIEFLRQFKNIKRFVININSDVTSNYMFGGSSNIQRDNLMYTISTILNFNNNIDVIIKGKNTRDFHALLLKELLKYTNYKKIEFDVDQTQMNSTYCDKWKTFIVNSANGFTTLRSHCESNGIMFVHNIM